MNIPEICVFIGDRRRHLGKSLDQIAVMAGLSMKELKAIEECDADEIHVLDLQRVLAVFGVSFDVISDPPFPTLDEIAITKKLDDEKEELRIRKERQLRIDEGDLARSRPFNNPEVLI